MNRSGYLLAAALWVLASPCLAQANPAADKLAELEARIDQMAREGMRFTQCLAGSSLCAPTRCWRCPAGGRW